MYSGHSKKLCFCADVLRTLLRPYLKTFFYLFITLREPCQNLSYLLGFWCKAH